MVQRIPQLAELYELDETAWLDATAELIRRGLWEQVDGETLAEYLSDMALRDKREVLSRLTVLLTHLLKWEYQPEGRSRSWSATVERERQELLDLIESGTLRNHANAIIEKAYRNAVRRAAVETGLPESTFPADCRYTLDTVLTEALSEQ